MCLAVPSIDSSHQIVHTLKYSKFTASQRVIVVIYLFEILVNIESLTTYLRLTKTQNKTLISEAILAFKYFSVV